jgi:hypothetical protein
MLFAERGRVLLPAERVPTTDEALGQMLHRRPENGRFPAALCSSAPDRNNECNL